MLPDSVSFHKFSSALLCAKELWYFCATLAHLCPLNCCSLLLLYPSGSARKEADRSVGLDTASKQGQQKNNVAKVCNYSEHVLFCCNFSTGHIISSATPSSAQSPPDVELLAQSSKIMSFLSKESIQKLPGMCCPALHLSKS